MLFWAGKLVDYSDLIYFFADSNMILSSINKIKQAIRDDPAVWQ